MASGRNGGLGLANEILVMVASLNQEGDELTAEAIMARFGKTREEAEKILTIVIELGGEDMYLPVSLDDDGNVTLTTANGLHGRPLRLTGAQTLALQAALERLGVGAQSPVAAQISESVGNRELDPKLVSRVLSPALAGNVTEVSSACAHAIGAGRALTFDYTKSGSTASMARHVVPSSTDYDDGTWFMRGFDLDRQGTRVFRMDRMANVVEVEAPAMSRSAAANLATQDEERMVTITFRDPHYLELLPWHKIERISEKNGITAARAQWYGGAWLPRMIAACAGTATTDDAELNAAVTAYAKGLLAH